jgi:hypothetical protein
MIGHFKTPDFDWNHGFSVPDGHYYCKLKGNAIHTSTCLLNLHERIDAEGSSNLFGLICSNLAYIDVTFLHSPLVMKIILSLVNLLKIASVRIVNLFRGIIIYYTVFSRIMTADMCTIPICQPQCYGTRCCGTGNSP